MACHQCITIVVSMHHSCCFIHFQNMSSWQRLLWFIFWVLLKMNVVSVQFHSWKPKCTIAWTNSCSYVVMYAQKFSTLDNFSYHATYEMCWEVQSAHGQGQYAWPLNCFLHFCPLSPLQFWRVITRLLDNFCHSPDF